MTSSTDLAAQPAPAGPVDAPSPPVPAPPRRGASPRPRAPFRPHHLFFYLLLGVVALSSVSAYAWVFNVSMKTNAEFISSPPWQVADGWRWENYANAWDRANIGLFFGNSVVVSVASTAIGVVLAVFAAYPLARITFRFSGLVLGAFLLGLMIPWMVTFAPLYLIMQDLGLLDSRIGLVLVYATYNLPFNVFVLVGFMKTLPYELEEAAAMDGAGPTRTFLSVILPLMGPGLASVAIISFLQNWNEFFYALLLIHTPEKMPLPLGLFQLGQAADYGTNWATLFAGMMITVTPVLLGFALLQKHITKGLTAGALKG
ncbi:sugar ABC transporter permease [Sphaerisporangium siamense]|uniref:ABC-type glycerol-3-phosphate transport system permease component n=1 Tax=Sphaerisporangium siamense TaxID=795645 RepID=A0A7W7DF21_9ACTN|nr:carbohydrate ABC transporter permease [Sphaerisporangium siamense]MBB4704148.1 ABC-type glycerol-3-phosphate transport system permease component [Sphaerisporangium siamense]GII85171.1 sugar ABC transporter permease [Sphaerisporangium siamense]